MIDWFFNIYLFSLFIFFFNFLMKGIEVQVPFCCVFQIYNLLQSFSFILFGYCYLFVCLFWKISFSEEKVQMHTMCPCLCTAHNSTSFSTALYTKLRNEPFNWDFLFALTCSVYGQISVLFYYDYLIPKATKNEYTRKYYEIFVFVSVSWWFHFCLFVCVFCMVCGRHFFFCTYVIKAPFPNILNAFHKTFLSHLKNIHKILSEEKIVHIIE